MTQPQPTVTVYRTRHCPFCIAAAEYLSQRDIAVEEVFLDDHPDRQGFTSAILPGHDTVPLVVIGGDPIGGFNELRALEASGDLARRLGR